MSRITLQDTTMDVVVNMSEGNPGALNCIMQILTEHEAIDPQALMGGLGAVMMFDTWGIYGSHVYVLFNDHCKSDVRRLLMLIRATQLGHFSADKLCQMAADEMREICLTSEEWTDLDEKVCAELKDFKRLGS